MTTCNNTHLTETTGWIILHLAPQLGPEHLRKCLALYPSPPTLCQLSLSKLQQLKLTQATITSIQNPDWEKIKRIIDWSEQPRHTLLNWNDPRYPPLLKEIHAPPPILYVDGSLPALQQTQMAVVGSRKPSHTGLRLARYFTESLIEAGLTVTSGLAHGIDTVSHQTAIDKKSTTIAVLGTGINQIYPRQNQRLFDKIREQGAIISEFTIDTGPIRKNFPQRNRIISGLCLGTLVIEASKRSGSLITARLASEQGREVFAVPGSINNPMAAGCHQLIQQGAKLTTGINDILDEIPTLQRQHIDKPPIHPLPKLDKDHQKLLECIGFDIAKFEQLADSTEFSVQKVSALLCNLLLQGYIKEELGGYSRVI